MLPSYFCCLSPLSLKAHRTVWMHCRTTLKIQEPTAKQTEIDLACTHFSLPLSLYKTLQSSYKCLTIWKAVGKAVELQAQTETDLSFSIKALFYKPPFNGSYCYIWATLALSIPFICKAEDLRPHRAHLSVLGKIHPRIRLLLILGILTAIFLWTEERLFIIYDIPFNVSTIWHSCSPGKMFFNRMHSCIGHAALQWASCEMLLWSRVVTVWCLCCIKTSGEETVENQCYSHEMEVTTNSHLILHLLYKFLFYIIEVSIYLSVYLV